MTPRLRSDPSAGETQTDASVSGLSIPPRAALCPLDRLTFCSVGQGCWAWSCLNVHWGAQVSPLSDFSAREAQTHVLASRDFQSISTRSSQLSGSSVENGFRGLHGGAFENQQCVRNAACPCVPSVTGTSDVHGAALSPTPARACPGSQGPVTHMPTPPCLH